MTISRSLSVVVIAHDMRRELPRTIHSLSPAMQRGVKPQDYELIVVDNDSAEPVATWLGDHQQGQEVRILRLEATSPSPAAAVNAGLAAASAPLVGVMIDGARLASPGLLWHALLASRVHPRPVITTMGFHLGPDTQQRSTRDGYDRAEEDRLLESVDWTLDGYRLFDVSSLAGSSRAGWFGPIAESNALFLPAALWDELGGYDERFVSPGGGLGNLDTYARACALPDVQVVMLLGEATFHQVHGGVTTNSATSHWAEFHAEYTALRGHGFSTPVTRPLYLGSPSPQALGWLEASAARARAANDVRSTASSRSALRRVRRAIERVMPLRGTPVVRNTVESGRDTSRSDTRGRYVSLLKKALLNETGLEAEAAFFALREASERGGSFDDAAFYDVRASMPKHFRRLEEARRIGRQLDRQPRNVGFAHTMIGRERLESLERCVLSVLDDDIPGDLIECGVWRGGAAILMRGILAAYGVSDRTVWVADSFAGLAVPESEQDSIDLRAERRPELVVPLARVRGAFALFDLLDDQVRFLEGWFKDTLRTAPIASIALLRLDGDYYESTLTSLTALYDRVSPGGYIIVDDYNFLPPCRVAVDEFRAARGIDDPISSVDWSAAYWRKSG